MDPTSDVIAGYQGKAYISVDGGATLVEFAQLRKYDKTVSRNMLDAGTHATAANGWKKKKPGMADWTNSMDLLLATNDDSEDMVMDAIENATEVFFAFDPDGTEPGNRRDTGNGYIKDIKESSPYNEISTFSVSIEGNGPLARGVVPAVAVSLQAAAAQVPVNGTVQLTANVMNTETKDVTYAVTGGAQNGSVDANGLYKAPAAVPNPAEITITATSVKDGQKSASVQITITAN